LTSEALAFYQRSFAKTVLYMVFSQNPNHARTTAMKVGELERKVKTTKDPK